VRRAGALVWGAALALGCRAAVPGPPPARVSPPVAAVAIAPAPPPLPAAALRPAAAGRAQVLWIARRAPAARIDADLAPLGARVGTSIDAAGWLLARLTRAVAGVELPPAVAAGVDPARPAVALGLAPALGAATAACAAVPFADDQAARRALDALGTEVARRGTVSRRRLADGREVWAAWGARALFLARQQGSVEATGALALEEMARPAPGDLSRSAAWVELRPHALGPALPLLFQLGLAGVLKAEAPGASDDKLAALREMAAGMAEGVTQIEALSASLRMDEQAGLAVHLTAVPRSGGPLARALADAQPYALDRRTGAQGGRNVFVAFAARGPLLDGLAWLAEHSGPAGRRFDAALSALRADLDGSVSCALGLRAPVEMGCVWTLRARARAARVLAQYAAFLRTSNAWNAAVGRGPAAPPRIQRKGDLVQAEEPVVETRLTAADRRSLLGGDRRRTVAAVRDGALLTAQGPEPRAGLAALQAAGADPASPWLRGALDRTASAHALLAADLVSVVMKLTGGLDDPSLRQVHRMLLAVPGLADLQAPLVAAVRGGDTLDLELALPPETIEGIGRILRPFMGHMGPGAPR
jgi:hypothetical protein